MGHRQGRSNPQRPRWSERGGRPLTTTAPKAGNFREIPPVTTRKAVAALVQSFPRKPTRSYNAIPSGKHHSEESNAIPTGAQTTADINADFALAIINQTAHIVVSSTPQDGGNPNAYEALAKARDEFLAGRKNKNPTEKAKELLRRAAAEAEEQGFIDDYRYRAGGLGAPGTTGGFSGR